MKLSHLFVGVLLLGISCTTARMQVDDDLSANAVMMPVKGRQGWQINQQLTFGPFTSSRVQRGWTKGYDIPFVIHFSGAKEKLSFSLGREGLIADIMCLGKLREQDLPLFGKLFEINLKTTDAFTGTVFIDGYSPYNFYIANLNRNNNFYEVEGEIIQESKGEYMRLRPVRRQAGDKATWGQRALGFEFIMDGQLVGGVETMNQGKIWLHRELSDHQQLVIASVAAALLLRSDLETDIDI